MPAIEQFQLFIVEGLDAQTDTIDGEVADAQRVFAGQVIRIGFHGNFCLCRHLIGRKYGQKGTMC